MNSYRRGLPNGFLVNPKLSILEKSTWALILIVGQTWSNVLKTCIIWYGSLHIDDENNDFLYLEFDVDT